MLTKYSLVLPIKETLTLAQRKVIKGRKQQHGLKIYSGLALSEF